VHRGDQVAFLYEPGADGLFLFPASSHYFMGLCQIGTVRPVGNVTQTYIFAERMDFNTIK